MLFRPIYTFVIPLLLTTVAMASFFLAYHVIDWGTRRGYLRRAHDADPLPFRKKLIVELSWVGVTNSSLAFLGYVALGRVMGPISLDLGLRPLEFFLVPFVFFLCMDTWGFFWHRLLHKSQYLFDKMHSGHHLTGANIDVSQLLSSKAPFALEYTLVQGIPFILYTLALIPIVGHYPLIPLIYTIFSYILHIAFTHCGLVSDLKTKVVRMIVFFPMAIVPTSIFPEEHQKHHQDCSTKFAPMFSHWDHLFGTWTRRTGPRCERKNLGRDRQK